MLIAFDDGRPDASFALEGCGDPEDFATRATFLLLDFSEQAPDRENGYGAVAYAQSPPAPGLDEYEHSQDDPEQIARFVALLDDHDIDPDGYVSLSDPTCPGGTSTVVSLFDTSETEPHVIARMEFDDCGPSSGFGDQASELIAEWRRAGP